MLKNRNKSLFSPLCFFLCASASLCSTSSFAEVRTIQLPRYASDLPDAEGREAFATSCMSCHSTAYMNQQPTMTAEKWKAEVEKMQKTYGCPIADEQIPSVVSYVMAVKENASGSHIHESPVVLPPPIEPVLPAQSERQRDKDAQRGQGIFQQVCAPCHGPDGRGTGPAGLVLLPHPADLTGGKLSDLGVANPVCNGIPGTAMAAFRTLPPADLQALEAYVLTLAPADDPAPPKTHSEETKKLFLENCASCHGPEGHGDGYAAPALARPPADFRMRRPAADYAPDVIATGVPGTAMPAWKSKLSENQRYALSDYVRSLFDQKDTKAEK